MAPAIPLPLPPLRLHAPLPPPSAPVLALLRPIDLCLTLLLLSHSYPADPCSGLPGTAGKVQTMEARAGLHLPLCRADDAQLGDREGYLGGPMAGEGEVVHVVRAGASGRIERSGRRAA